ncbi:MAG TPA: tripartite tricarboxylate transporter TctB family protein [Bradyrhizobium sp.]|nr:tripartite tricarboxylate transporter TctB family protein [Bradyrhizobium sp.]
MADTLGHSPGKSTPASSTANVSAAIGILVLAVAPQLFELIWSIGALALKSKARAPLQVLAGHGAALLYGAPAQIFASLTTPGKAAIASDTLLAMIYSYPLFAVAVFTLFVKVKAPQDYFGGVVLMALALFALWASSDLQGMRGFSFGAGTAPRMFSVLMLGLAAAIAMMGLSTDGPPLAKYHWRGPLFVSLSILSFACTIRPLGLVLSAFATFMIAALGTRETRWMETIIVGVVLTAFCSFLFPYGLGLPMQLWPPFLIQ